MGKATPNREGIEASGGNVVKRRALLVAGMHRSGTSAVARSLSLLGATMPRSPLPPGWKGEINWGESDPIVALHDELLAAAGSSWHDVSPFPASWYGSAAADEYRARMVEVVADEYGDSSLFVIKDPRMCRLVPFWLVVLEELAVEPAFVLPVRNPLEVAASLARRNRLSTARGLLLWLRHVLDAERDTRARRRALVAYEDLLGDPRASVRRLRDQLGLPGASAKDPEADGEGFLSAEERHHSFSAQELDAREDVTDWAKQAYATLLDACRSDDPPDYHALDSLSAALGNAELCYRPLLAEGEASAGRRELRATQELHEKQQELERARRTQAQDLAEVRRRERSWAEAARQIERSRTWRLGNLVVRALRIITFRRPVSSGGPGDLAARIESAEAAGPGESPAPRRYSRREQLAIDIDRARDATRAQEWDQALSRWRGVIERFGDDAPALAYRRLSQASRQVGDQGAAEEAVARGLERFPDDVALHVELAELAMAAGDWDQAVICWRAVLDRFGDEAPPVAEVGLIRALLNSGDVESADAVATRQAARQVDNYQDWILANDLLEQADRSAIRGRIASMSEQPTFSVLMPVYDPRPQHLRRAVESVLAQLYPRWELCIVDDASTDSEVREILAAFARNDERVKVRLETRNGGIATATNTALELATGEWIALLDHDDVLAEHALYLMAEAVATSPNATALYSDSDHLDERERRINPYFKPDWDLDLFLAQNYINHLSVYPADLARAVGGFRPGYEGSQDWDFTLRVIEAAASNPVVHIPHVLYHWRVARSSFSQASLNEASDSGGRVVSEHLERIGLDATVEPGVGPAWHRIRWTVPSPLPLVSAVIPTRDRVELLRPCVEGITGHTEYPALEIVVVDNGSRDPKTLGYLEAIGERDDVLVVRDDGDFEYSRLCNRGVAASRGEVVLLLNNDIEVIDPGWLRELVGHAMRPEVGAVGAKLYYPNDSIQHAGVILGLGKVADHAFRFMPRISESSEPFGRTRLTRSYSAVTAACMAVRREIYEELDGLDEVNLRVSYSDVDLCLRIREAGYRVVWTPFAELYHHESLSRGTITTPEEMARRDAEVDYMNEVWGELLTTDPFYNPNLSLSTADFSLATPTRARKPWRDRIEATADPPAMGHQSEPRRERAGY